MSKHPGGRPTKYKEEYNKIALDLIGVQGKTVVEFAANVGVDKATVYRWAEKYPEFRASLTRAQDVSEAYWMEKLVGFMTERDANAKLISLYLANRFGWRSEGKKDSERDQKPAPVQINIVSDNGKSE